jgi:hypothetical protein
MNQSGSSLENEPDDPFARAARQIAEILSGTGVASCEMTLTMNDTTGTTLSSTLIIDSEDLDEDRAPDQLGLGGVFALFTADGTSEQ